MNILILVRKALGATNIARAASADAVNSHGFHAASGGHLGFDGPSQVTPGCKQITRDYDQRRFRYVISPSELLSGAAVTMALLDNDNMKITGGFAGTAGRTNITCAERDRLAPLSDIFKVLDVEGMTLLDKTFEGGADSGAFGKIVLAVLLKNKPFVIPHQAFETAYMKKVEGILENWSSETPPQERLQCNELRKQAFQRLRER